MNEVEEKENGVYTLPVVAAAHGFTEECWMRTGLGHVKQAEKSI